MTAIKTFIANLPTAFRYLFNSCFVTVIDIIIVYILNQKLSVEIVTANTCGVVTGFLLGYFLTARYVFLEAKGAKGFSIYFITFIIGLILANLLIYTGNKFLFIGLPAKLNFLLSKGISIVIPFFFLFYLRKSIYQRLEIEHS